MGIAPFRAGRGATFGRPECTPIFFSRHRKENGRARSKEKMFSGLSEHKAPRSLYAGVVSASAWQKISNPERSAAASALDEELLTPLNNCPPKISYSLHTLAAAPRISKNFPAFSVGRTTSARRLWVRCALTGGSYPPLPNHGIPL